MFVKTLSIIPYSNNVMIELDDKKMHGLVDGNHTYETLCSIKKDLGDDVMITIEFIVGLNDTMMEEILAIAEGRNTSTELTQYSLQNFGGCFDIIKQVLADKYYADNISYKENDAVFDMYGELEARKEHDVREILTIMGVMVSEWCTFKSKLQRQVHPYKFYSGKSGSTSYMANKEKYNLIATSYIHLLPEFLALYDYIYFNMPTWYNAGVKSDNENGGKFGKTTIFSRRKDLKLNADKSFVLLTGLTPRYTNIMFAMPLIILASLRQFLKLNEDNKYMWDLDPMVFLDKCGPKLVVSLYSGINECGKNSKAYINRSDFVWNYVYVAAKECYLEYIKE